MKLSLILFALIVNYCKAESSAKPDVLFIQREQEPGDDLARVYSNQSPTDDMRSPSKTIVINGVSHRMAKEQPQHVMQAVVNAVQSQFKQDMANGLIKQPNVTGLDIPDVFFSEPVREVNQQSVQQQLQQPQQQLSMVSSPEVIRRVYKLPIVTRMISREEETDNNIRDLNSTKKTLPNVWRSPIPFMHNDCIHAINRNKAIDRKLKSYRKKGRKHHKTHLSLIRPIESDSSPLFIRPMPHFKTIEAINESAPQVSPLHTLFMSLMPRFAEPEPEALQSLESKVKAPSAVLMAITRKIEPQIEHPFRSENTLKPEMPLIMTFLRKIHEKQEPEELPLPFNPFFGLMSKLLQKPITPKRFDFLSEREPIHEEKVEKPINNYNFNVNFTINNNNYAKKESNPLLDNSIPFPFFKNL